METEKPKRTRTPKLPIAANPEVFNWGKREFGIIAKSFEAEPAQVQATMIGISSMLQLIKLNLSEQPLVISYLVRKAIPELSEVAILGNLQEGAIGLDLPGKLPGEALPDFLTSLAGYTSNMTDTQHNSFWHGMFCAIAAPLTQWEKVAIYSEYVYQVIVKPSIK